MEKNKIKIAWIWLWYNDITRVFIVLIPTYFVVLIPFMLYIGVPENAFSNILSIVYVIVLVWGVCDNDYSNLRRIGLDEYRRPINRDE